MISVEQVQLDYQNKLMGVVELPQISWSLKSEKRETSQTNYWIQLADDDSFENLLYNTNWVKSIEASQILLPSNEISLQSGHHYFIRVKVRSNYAEESEWSLPTPFVTGIINKSEWMSEFISGETIEDKNDSKSTLVRGTFSINRPVKEAYAFCTAQGLYKSYLNNKKIGKDELTPGWTSYNKRLLYQTYDITDMLHQGENVFGAIVGAGWYKGKMGFLDERNNYGEFTSFLGQLLIRFTDGTCFAWGTSTDFLTHDGPIIFSEIYDGEIYDGRLECPEWLTIGTPDEYSDWKSAKYVDVNKEILYPQPSNRPTINEQFDVKEIMTTPEGDTVLDFGQNLSGWVEIKVTAPRGSKVEIECFEILDKNGNVYQDNLRGAKQKIIYITKGEGEETFHPSFTFQGFRYAKVTQFPIQPKEENFKALAVYSQMDTTGKFECSNVLVNQLQHNIEWSLKSNFVDIPTDCPQRNERVGWTGDAQIFCRTANYIMNAYGFFSKWLKDVAADQLPEGGVPHIVPDIITGKKKASEDWLLSQGTHSAAVWADVAVIAPWTLYLTYGDKQILIKQFDSMKKWIDFMRDHSKDYIWNYKLQFGDWVALDAEEGSYFGATPNDLTCTAYFAYSTNLFAKMCKVLGKDTLSEEYSSLYEKIKNTYQRHFLTSDGRLTVKTQTAHIVSLYFDLVPQKWRSQIAKDLVKLLDEKNGHLVTGFVGTPYFCHVLSDNGYVNEAYDLLLKEDFPSWLYQVNKGATTIWEHWDGIKEDGSMWSPDMNSFNHYAYGAIGEWLYRKVLGIEIDEKSPGYQHILFHPLVNSHFDYAKGSYQSVHGKIYLEWKYLKEKNVQINVCVPVNTNASLCLDNCLEIKENDGIKFTSTDKDNQFKGELVSGKYTISYKVK